MEPETEQKIEETVLEIVKSSDLHETTLKMVVNMASSKLNLDLSEPDRKHFVKQVIHTYLTDLREKPIKAEPEPDKDNTGADRPTKVEPEPDKDNSGKKQMNEAEPKPDNDNSAAKQAEEEPEEENEEELKRKRGDSNEYDDNGHLIICKLSERRRVTIQDYRLKTLVTIRDYYRKDGKDCPSSKGISLSTEQWLALKKNVPVIEKAIRNMESKLN